jgi:hypothetical protein
VASFEWVMSEAKQVLQHVVPVMALNVGMVVWE